MPPPTPTPEDDDPTDPAARANGERPSDRFWRRHSNPRSGWSRVPTGPVLVYAVYRRDPRLLAAALVWTVINPVLFAAPDDESAWMTRAVLAERWWIRERGRSTVGLDRPNVWNAAGAAGFCYALYAAWRRRPAGAALGSALSVGLKLWWLRALIRRYDRRQDRSTGSTDDGGDADGGR